MPLDEDVSPHPRNGSAHRRERPYGQVGGYPSAPSTVIQYACRGAWVVVACGSYDIDTITPLREALTTAAREHPKVIVDASGVDFADSSFLNLLIQVHTATTLRVAAPGRQMRRLFEITGTSELLGVRATVEDAAAT